MATKTLYFYKSASASHQPIFYGGELSVSSGSTSSSDKQITQISIWVDITDIKDLDIKSVNSVTLSYQGMTSANSSINYSYLKYRIKSSGSDDDKIGLTQTSNLPTSYATRTHDMGVWTKDELCAGDGAHLYLQVFMAVPWLTNSTVKLKDVKLIVDYTLNLYTLTVNATAGGNVTGGGSYESGKTANLTATPNEGYKFVSWSDGDTSASRTVTVTENASYTAVFEKVTLPEISSVRITPNPCEAGQGFIISVGFTE